MNYYNEHDLKAAAWLEELIASRDLPLGLVDSRDVQRVGPTDLLHQYDQCHFFAGIGGWPLALRLAGWPEDRAIWTASLPCQPFSDAGKQLGTSDERHLWPVFRDLVEHYRPQYLIGEQVASKAGRAWFAALQLEMEALGYRCGAVDLCASGFGAPHIRQRLFWCAVRMGIPDGEGWLPRIGAAEDTGHRDTVGPDGGDGRNPWGNAVAVPCSDGKSRLLESCLEPLVNGFPTQLVRGGNPCAPQVAFPPLVTQQTDNVNNTSEARTMRLRGYGNAIVVELAAEFVRAFMDILTDTDA